MLDRPRCLLRVFLYPGYHTILHERALAVMQEPVFSTKRNRMAFTAELSIYHRLVSACKRVKTPADADVYLVPAMLGTAIVAGWQGERTAIYGAWLSLLSADRLYHNRTLPFLTAATAPRHIFLCSVDSQFVYLGRPRTDAEASTRAATRNTGTRAATTRIGTELGVEHASIWVHLGDDHYTALNKPRYQIVPGPDRAVGRIVPGPSYHIPNGLIVPYRISQWMPQGNPPTARLPKTLLLFATINPTKHASRRRLVASIHNQSARSLGGRLSGAVVVHATGGMLSTSVAAKGASRARFCLCPTGDSKGHTARFYFSLAHQCIPVRVDGHGRNLPLEQLALPFPSLIDWRKVIVDVPPAETDTLLERLASMPQEELERRTRYLRKIAPWLMFDREHQPDATDAFLYELEQRVLGGGDAGAMGRGSSARRVVPRPPYIPRLEW